MQQLRFQAGPLKALWFSFMTLPKLGDLTRWSVDIVVFFTSRQRKNLLQPRPQRISPRRQGFRDRE